MYYSIYETAKNASGSAMEENEKYMRSLQARINQVRSEFEQLAVKVGEAFLSEGIIGFTSALGRMFEVLVKVVDSFGALPILLTAVGATILLVNNRFRLLFANIATGRTTMASLSQAFMATASSASLAAISTNALKVAVRGLGASLVVLAPLMAVGMALEFVVGKMTEARERSEELKREMKAMTDSFAQDSANIKDLASTIKEMEEQLASGGVSESKMSEFTADLIEKRNQLADLMPSLKKGEDEYGNAILHSNAIVETQISLAERQLSIQQKIDAAKTEKDRIENLKALEKEQQKLNQSSESYFSLLQNIGIHTGQNKFLLGEKVFDDVSVKNMEDAIDLLNKMEVAKQEAMDSGNTNLANNIEDSINKYSETLAELQFITGQQESVRVQLVSDSQQALLEVLSNSTQIEEGTQKMLANISELVANSGLGVEQARTLINEIAFSLQNDEAFKGAIDSYQNTLSQLDKARENFNAGKITEEAYMGQFDKVSKELDIIMSKIVNMAKKHKIDIDSTDFQNLIREIGIVDSSMAGMVKKASEISSNTGVPLAQVIANLNATGEAFDSTSESAEKLSGILQALNSSSSDALTDVLLESDRLAQSYAEAEQALRNYTEAEIENVIAKQERISAMETEGVVTEYLTVSEQLLIDEINNSTEAYEQLLDMYGYLFDAEQLSRMSKAEIMKAINAEIISVDDLNIAIQALKDGKLDADTAMAIKGAQKAKQNIHNINEEIRSLKLLVEAYEKTAQASVKAAVSAGESAYLIGQSKGLDSQEYKTALNAAYELGNKAIIDQTALSNAKNSIRTYEAQIQELNNTVQQYSGTVKKVADQNRAAYSTIGKGREYDNAEAMRKANEALEKNSKASKGNTAAKKDNAKATKDGAKAEELATFWANKHKESIEEVTLALKAQEIANKNLPKHSQEYKKGLQEVLKLEKLKLELMKAQERSLKQQIESGNIIKAGVQTQSQAQAQAKGTGSGSKVSVASGTRNLAGWNGVITSGYGGRYDPFTKNWTGHQGVDIASPLGTKLESNIGGKVLFAGMGTGDWQTLGNYVAIQAVDGLVHYYGHLQKVAVKAGEQVVKGQQIGNIGSTGRSSGPHLHYGIRQNGQWINPTKKMNQSRGLQAIQGNNPTQPKPTQNVAGGSIEAQIWSFLKSKGLSDNAVAGIMGNMQAESNYNPKAVNSIGASGLVQWLGGRKTNLMSFAKNKGTNWTDVQTQLEFLWKELNSTEGKTLSSLKQGDKLSAQQHAANFERLFERSGGALMQRRQGAASDALKRFKGTGFESSGFVDKEVASNIQDVNNAYSELLGLQGNIIDQNEKIREIEEQILNVYFDAINAKRQEHMQTIAYEEEKMKALDNTSQRYAKTLEIQIRNLEAKQGYNLEEMDYIDYLIKNTRMSADRLNELSVRYGELQTEILATNNELQEFNALLIEVDMRRFEETIRRMSTEFDYLSTIRGTLEQGGEQYNDLTAQMIELARQQAYQTQQQATELQHLSSVRDLSIEQLKDYNQRIHELNKQYWQLQGTIQDLQKAEEEYTKTTQEKIVNDLIEAYKQYLGEKRDMHMKSLDEERKREDERHKKVMDNYRDEMNMYQKAYDLKIKEIDRDDSQKSYEEQMRELGIEKGKVTTKINLLVGDDSLEAKQKRKKLQLELDKINKDIEKAAYSREIEMTKQNLGDKLDLKKEEMSKKEEEENKVHEETIKRIDREREYWEKHYTDLLNDERKFAQLREQLMQGHFDALSTEFQAYIKEMEDTMPSLEDTLDGTMQAVGTSIRQNIIDNLNEALKLMSEFQSSQNSGGQGGSSSGGGASVGGDGQQKPASEGDFWVLAGKYMIDEISKYSDDPVRLKSIQEKGYTHAAQGRDMGSEIAGNIDFEDALRQMSLEDQQKFADFIINNADDLVITGEYQDMFKRMAWQILNRTAGFDTGGYTGKFSGGKLATLHGEELILNKKQTGMFDDVTTDLSRLRNIVGLLNPKAANIENSSSTVSDFTVQMNIEKMVANDESEAKNYAEIVSEETINSMIRKGWRP